MYLLMICCCSSSWFFFFSVLDRLNDCELTLIIFVGYVSAWLCDFFVESEKSAINFFVGVFVEFLDYHRAAAAAYFR